LGTRGGGGIPGGGPSFGVVSARSSPVLKNEPSSTPVIRPGAQRRGGICAFSTDRHSIGPGRTKEATGGRHRGQPPSPSAPEPRLAEQGASRTRAAHPARGRRLDVVAHSDAVAALTRIRPRSRREMGRGPRTSALRAPPHCRRRMRQKLAGTTSTAPGHDLPLHGKNPSCERRVRRMSGAQGPGGSRRRPARAEYTRGCASDVRRIGDRKEKRRRGRLGQTAFRVKVVKNKGRGPPFKTGRVRTSCGRGQRLSWEGNRSRRRSAGAGTCGGRSRARFFSFGAGRKRSGPGGNPPNRDRGLKGRIPREQADAVSRSLGGGHREEGFVSGAGMFEGRGSRSSARPEIGKAGRTNGASGRGQGGRRPIGGRQPRSPRSGASSGGGVGN